MNTSGNTILITGGTSGIGLAFAKEFLNRGNTVIICGRREDRLASIKEQYPMIVTTKCNLADANERVALADWVIKNYPSVNILMNNAGVQLDTNLTETVDLEKVNEEVTTNLIAPIHLGSLFTPHLKNSAGAAIINITSGLAFVPIAFMPVYCATKAAMHSLTMSQRYQLKDSGIKVFEIAPPSTDTELGHQRRTDKTRSHGGIPISEFLAEAMVAIEQDLLEAPIGQSKGMIAKRDELFPMLNR